jgi:protein-disulfide isomerase
MKNKSTLTQAALLIAGILAGFLIGQISFPAETVTTETREPVIAEGIGARQTRIQPETYLKPKVFETVTGVSADGDPYLGPADARLTIIEFSDYQCVYCKKYFSEAYAQIKKDYVDTGKVKYVIRDFPVNEHPQALLAAGAANCAGAQDRFQDMHDLLFTAQDKWSYQDNAENMFKDYARQLDLDENKFSACLGSDSTGQEIAKDVADGVLYKVAFTPTIFVGDKKIVGAQPYEVFKQVIDSELNKLWQTQEM